MYEYNMHLIQLYIYIMNIIHQRYKDKIVDTMKLDVSIVLSIFYPYKPIMAFEF